jgi:hypothetical protein
MSEGNGLVLLLLEGGTLEVFESKMMVSTVSLFLYVDRSAKTFST